MTLSIQSNDHPTERENIGTEHEFCLRCGRKLKNPTARERGYGAVCEKKMRVTNAQRLFNNNISERS